jgi:cyclopropane fatty-acyl-phospholipid synthase-like methyltransferase
MKVGYNERLFGGSRLRRSYHEARFVWFRDAVAKHGMPCRSLFELGCFDGRLLDHCPTRPERYVGVDANWEGGLDMARDRFRDAPGVILIESRDPGDLSDLPSGGFDVAAALETLEHLPEDRVEDYLSQIARLTDGYFLVTVPNEKGLVFFLKFLAKRLLFGGGEAYTFAEFVNATLGRMDRVRRHDHKGFDHAKLAARIERHFDMVAVTGLPFRRLPPSLNLTVAMLARSR